MVGVVFSYLECGIYCHAEMAKIVHLIDRRHLIHALKCSDIRIYSGYFTVAKGGLVSRKLPKSSICF